MLCYDTLFEDWEAFLQRHSLPHVPLAHINSSKNRYRSSNEHGLSSKALDALRHFYREDIDLLHRFELPDGLTSSNDTDTRTLT